MAKSVIVIGSGIAGLAASIRLANKGYIVTVFESNDRPGGKLSEIRLGDYRFDAGPSLFTLPEHVEDLFALSGERVDDHFQYKKLDTTCQYFYADGTHVKAYAEVDKFVEEVHTKLDEPTINITKALQKSEYLYDNLEPLFMQRSLHKLGTWINGAALKSLAKFGKFDFNRTMHQANKSRFKNSKTVQLFDRYATYNGSDPFQTPATMNIIPHLELGRGAYFPLKGMNSISQSLYELAKKVGVNFHFNTPVDKIVLHKGAAKGVNTPMGFHIADRVVSNMDMVATYKRLLQDQKHPTRLLNQEKSSSALIFYWGIRKEFKELDLHNIFFSKDYKDEFDHIFNEGSVSDDPTVYLNITSTHKPDDAPEGCQNWFTMINVPNNSGQDWDTIIEKSRVNILRKLSAHLKTDIESLIEVEDILEPRSIEALTSSWQGALYGNSSNSKYSAFLRHPNFSKDIEHLYFCGGSVHPGGGIPMCLLSAKIMVDNFK